MNIKRVLTLIKKEFSLGSRSFIFIWAFLAPLLITFIMSVLMGVFLVRAPRLGLYLASPSQVLSEADNTKAISTKEFGSVEALKDAVSQGVIDVGVVIPEGFDSAIRSGTKASLQAFVFGESYARNRAIIVTTLGNIIRKIAGQELPLEIQSFSLGDESAIPAKERVFPLVVLISIFFGGLLIPSASLIEEKRKKTIDAISVSTTKMTEVMTAKIFTGAVVALVAGFFTLLLNRSFGGYPFELVVILILGVMMASFIGTLLGIYVNDITTLLSFWKIGGIVLFFPAIVYIFPKIPKIVAKFFPTYYVLEPIIEITKGSVDLRAFWTNALVCLVLDVVLGTIVFIITKRVERQGFPALAAK